MVKLIKNGVFVKNATQIIEGSEGPDKNAAKRATMAYSILSSHDSAKSGDGKLKIKFDALASHDITYVGIIQTARASGLTEFPIPYVLTNCHNSLCAVGGTINEDDHVFGLSAAKKYGGIFVPAHLAVIHSYMRECQASCGKMILGSDSHTRYGALGTLAVGEGGPELVKQLLGRTYDIDMPDVVGVYLTGKPRAGVGPQDVALALIKATFESGFVKNSVLEFIGDGIANLPIDFRSGIDVMTTETTCLSSIWLTDNTTKAYFENHNRLGDYKQMKPGDIAYYDRMVHIDLSTVESMIALPFHPSNVYSIKELNENAGDILRMVEKNASEVLELPDGRYKLTDKLMNGKINIQQGVIAGCAGGTFDNIAAACDILKGSATGAGEFGLSVYPASQPVLYALTENGMSGELIKAGAVMRTAFCGPCFGAGDVPANNALSLRHTTRNFPNREGSKPGAGQIASVALADARSIAATAKNGGILTPATDVGYEPQTHDYKFDDSAYKSRVYYGYGKGDKSAELKFGPNIADWPKMPPLAENLLLTMCAVITDDVTTTDELIPSGETSSYRSNPLKLAEFTLSRKCPDYVKLAKDAAQASPPDAKTGIGSVIFANKPGDGSAREQAASCQRVLGGLANIAVEYATKRYRSNLINWGMLPLLIDPKDAEFEVGDKVLLHDIRAAVAEKREEIKATRIRNGENKDFTLRLGNLTDDERTIILSGCLINYYQSAKPSFPA